MVSSERERIRRSASSHYADGGPIWLPDDAWNDAKRLKIDAFCRAHFAAVVSADAIVLNAGAGSTNYEWIPPQTIGLDRFHRQIAGTENGVVGDVEMLPFRDSVFDVVVCVGSVLNYVSAIEALSELCRVLRLGGFLFLHFESSDSLEHIGSGRWRSDVALLPTINNGRPDVVWIYSRRFILRSLQQLGFRLADWEGFHVASAALLRLGASQGVAARAHRVDRWLGPLQRFGDDVILLAEKG
jgi:SAM-dependent methyltransferase